MFPWLFLFSPRVTWPHYRLSFSPVLHIDSSHEKLWELVIQVTDKNVELAKNNAVLATNATTANKVAAHSLQMAISAYEKNGTLSEHDLSELKVNLQKLINTMAFQ
ncbi:MAG TPA: hypothetical protein VJ577_08575 [Burkholderiaceae bacterium]|nr:hypothetical protein [Burkholderiaceae bacterium]